MINLKKGFSILCLTVSLAFVSNAQTWTQKSNINGSGITGASGFGINGKGYLVLGKDSSTYYLAVQEYNPISNSWSSKANFIGPTRVGAISFVIDSTAYVGLGSNASGSITYSDFYQYFPGLNIWVQRANFPDNSGRNSMGASVLGKGYIGGGANGAATPYSQKFYEYNAQINSWTQKANLPAGPRSTGIMFGLNGQIYFGLGHNGSQDYNDLWAYNPNTNLWTARSNFPGAARMQAKAMVVDGKVIVGGGFRLGVGLELSDYYAYDPIMDSWTSIASFAAGARANYTTFTIGNVGYLATGTDINNTPLNDLWSLSFNSVGIANDEFNDSGLELYPNPTSQKLYISSPDYSNSEHLFQVFSVQGKLVYQQRIFVNEEVSEITLPEIEAGVYMYTLTSNQVNFSGKLSIQH